MGREVMKQEMLFAVPGRKTGIYLSNVWSVQGPLATLGILLR